jgi:uncharacterized protein GlcG (DUF336 family)
MTNKVLGGVIAAALAVSASGAWAACGDVSRGGLDKAIAAAVAAGTATGGYGLPMWVTFVDETGLVCQVATSGTVGAAAGNSEWLGSRVISAQKAFTANGFSLDGYAISTANLYSAVQPGGSLFGLQHSNPVDASQAYLGSPNNYGTNKDPLVGKRIGGVNVFGGGLALYKDGKKVGAIGVSGDTSCRDHAFAWQVREALAMHPGGTGITTANFDAAGAVQTPLAQGLKGDEMIIGSGSSNYWNAWSQPACPNSLPAATTANGTLQAP